MPVIVKKNGSRSEFEHSKLSHLIADVLDNPHDAANIERVKAEVKKLTDAFPVYQA